MPTYEYACRACGEHLEVVQSFRDDALTECPACKGELRKVFSAAGIIFKGSGWHIKDYASASNKAGASNATSGGSSTDVSSGSSDTSSSKSDTTKSDTTKSGSNGKPAGPRPTPERKSA